MIRTVTAPAGYHRNREMSVIGYLIAAGLIVLILPLLPMLVLVWILYRLFGDDEERSRSVGPGFSLPGR